MVMSIELGIIEGLLDTSDFSHISNSQTANSCAYLSAIKSHLAVRVDCLAKEGSQILPPHVVLSLF